MKLKLFILFLALVSLNGHAQNSTVTIAWTPSVDATVTETRVYAAAGTSAPVLWVKFPQSVAIGTLTGLTSATTYKFWLTAATSTGLESLPSNVVTNYIPLKPPTNLRVIFP